MCNEPVRGLRPRLAALPKLDELLDELSRRLWPIDEERMIGEATDGLLSTPIAEIPARLMTCMASSTLEAPFSEIKGFNRLLQALA